MLDEREFYSLEKWKSLSLDEKREIWNHVWDPFHPQIGFITKSEIVECFVKNIKINALQYGIRSFGWYVYALYVVVEDSRIKVPEKFLDVNVNKGVFQKTIDKNKALVKFRYGGLTEIDLTDKVIIM
jgi:hypothetical protein